MRLALRDPLTFAIPAAAGALVALGLAGHPGTPYALLGLGAVIVTAGLVIWPWASVPAAVLGGALTSELLGLERVSPIVAVHLHFLAFGFVAIAIRRLVDPVARDRVRTPADLPMLALAAAILLGAGYGLARGHATHAVVVATYELGVIPAYFFLATLSLSSRAKLRSACVLYLGGAVVMAVAGLATPGRHGGLFSALALLPVLVAAANARSRARRWLLIAAAGLFGLDVALSAYRSIWLASAVALALLVAGGAARVRRLAAVSLAIALVIAAGATWAGTAVRSRTSLIDAQLHASSGYRVPEAQIGLDAFLARPLVGQGLGQVASQTYVAGFGVTDVGPTYHVFYVTLLANGGIVALALLLWAQAAALRRRRGSASAESFAWRCLLVGLLVSAAFAGPTDGHWELGLLPALVLLTSAPAPAPTAPARRRRRPAPRERPPAGAPGELDATAIVVTYNSAGEAPRCLGALVDAGVAVWVVDNGSTDDTVAIVRRRFPTVRVVANDTNRGFAQAVNQPLAQVDSEVVLLVNPDCVVSALAVQTLVEYLHANPGVGVVGPRIRDADGQVAISAHPFEGAASVLASRFGGSLAPIWLRRRLAAKRRRHAYAACQRGERAVMVDWVSGACMAIRRSLLVSVGGLDTGYFMYYEDEELCLRAWRANAKVAYLPAAEAVHSGGASSVDPAHVWPHLYRSLLRFHARNRPRTYGIVRGVVLARAVLGLALAAPRDAGALVAGRPARRALAWARIVRIAAAPTATAGSH